MLSSLSAAMILKGGYRESDTVMKRTMLMVFGLAMVFGGFAQANAQYHRHCHYHHHHRVCR